MSPRTHLGLRLFGVVAVVVASLWPRAGHDRAVASATVVASPAHFAVTTAGRRDEALRPKASLLERSPSETTAMGNP